MNRNMGNWLGVGSGWVEGGAEWRRRKGQKVGTITAEIIKIKIKTLTRKLQ